ncbi:F-box/LRR protein, partial [Medicago truncatula]
LEPDLDVEIDSSGLPGDLPWEVLRRLPPAGSLSAVKVCKGWRETARNLWKEMEELKLRVPVKVHVGFVVSMLQKCHGILRLSLRMERCEIFQIHINNKIN